MKNYIKSIITVAALMLCSTGVWADNVTAIVQTDGQTSNSGGTVTIDKPNAVAGETVIITTKPNQGYYLDPADITVIKTIDGSQAQTREPGYNTPLTVTHASGNDITGDATYTFVMPETGVDGVSYSVEVTVNFKQRISIDGATISTTGTFTYTGTAIVPETITVKVGNATLNVTTDYTLQIENNINPGEATITATGVGKYTGTETGKFTINKAKATLAYSTDKAVSTVGAEFNAPVLTVIPNGLVGITYASSDTKVATIDADGKVTLVGEGETMITASFAGNEFYEAASASYTLTVYKAQGAGYPLWVGDTQVTEDNCNDILGDHKRVFSYNPDNKTLLIKDNQNAEIVIESRLDNLKIYIYGNEGSKLKKIFYNNLTDPNNVGNLYFTCYDNTESPSKVVIKNTLGESAISGFKTIEYNATAKMTIIAAGSSKYDYKNGNMYQTITDDNGTETETLANELTIGQVLSPMDETVTFTLKTLQVVDENGQPLYNIDGTPMLSNLENAIVGDVLITLPKSNDENSDEGISSDDGDNRNGITIETTTMTDAKVKDVAKKVRSGSLIPGSSGFAEAFVGMTILLPAGYGNIKTDLISDPGYEFHILIVEDDSSRPSVLFSGRQYTPFDVKETTYCYIYLVKTDGAGTRLGKRNKAHGKVYSVGVDLDRALASSPSPSEASGGVIPVSEDPVLNTTSYEPYYPPTAIQTVKQDDADSDKWFTIEGQQISTPTKKGFYIKNGKKIVIQ